MLAQTLVTSKKDLKVYPSELRFLARETPQFYLSIVIKIASCAWFNDPSYASSQILTDTARNAFYYCDYSDRTVNRDPRSSILRPIRPHFRDF
jgi:hypothetical protein